MAKNKQVAPEDFQDYGGGFYTLNYQRLLTNNMTPAIRLRAARWGNTPIEFNTRFPSFNTNKHPVSAGATNSVRRLRVEGFMLKFKD